MFLGIRRIALVLSAFLAIGSLAWATGAEAQQPTRERIRPAFPQISFTERQLAGKAAVDRLGTRISDVANWYGKSADQLRRQLLSDYRVRLDSKGRMFVVEEMQAPLAIQATGALQSVNDGQLMPLDQTFALHSRPGANRTIYLDFNGATLTGTAWNSNGNTITAKPFDIDSVPGSFSNTELQRIQYIWQRVAEDYAAFDVDVTTEQPAAERLARVDTNDQVFGTTVLITDNAGVYSCNCGGIAYVGVFNSTLEKYKPALVFYNMLGRGDEKAVAEAISHEAGHNMGLSHDGNSSSAYYTGQGSDPVTGWAPIMGVGYSKPLVQFSKGEYAGANNKEDDFVVAQSYGLPLRSDDYGNTVYSASPFPGSGATQDGVIERAGDIDVFSVTAAAGAFSAKVSPANRSANADLVLSLVDGNGVVLASSSPQGALDASVSTQLPAAGTYYIKVSATGEGDPAVTGYSAYGSVGNYRVAATYTSATGSAPTAVLTANGTSGIAPASFQFDASQSTDSDGTVKYYYWDFGDGTSDNTGTLQQASKTYTTPGIYTVRLIVVDDSGFSASAVTSIAVASATPVKSVSAKSITLTFRKTTRGYAAKAVVVVANQDGQTMNGAAVNVTWSGVVSSGSTLSTRYGKATFTSPYTKMPGCYVVTINNITLNGYTFVPGGLTTQQICR